MYAAMARSKLFFAFSAAPKYGSFASSDMACETKSALANGQSHAHAPESRGRAARTCHSAPMSFCTSEAGRPAGADLPK